jgi:hypothetical protein
LWNECFFSAPQLTRDPLGGFAGMPRNRSFAYTLLILTLIPWVVWGIIVVILIQNPNDPAVLEPTSDEPLPSWIWAIVLVTWLTIGLMIYYIVHLYKWSGLSGLQRALWLALLVFANFLAMPFYWYNYVWSKRDAEAA